jgi:uncharacterized protein YcbK (DUF882 family)
MLAGLATGVAAAAMPGVAFSATGHPAKSDPSRPGTPLDDLVPSIIPELDLLNANTRETFRGGYFSFDSGRYRAEAIRDLEWFLRDWREGETEVVDPRLYWALSAISQAAMKDGHSGRIVVTSGYRTPRTNSRLEGAARNSLHLKGRAVDFSLEGVPTKPIFDYMVWLGVGGVGNYPRHHFVHIDSGRPRTW